MVGKAVREGACEICILAGGRSQRMGRDKSRLRLGGRTMLGLIRREARSLGWPVRVIRRDVVRRCGPVGGIYTALKSTRAEAVLFLACDMPFVTVEVMRSVVGKGGRAAFMRSEGGAGFPFVLPRTALAVVAEQIKRREFSLQALARVLKAKIARAPRALAWRLSNFNTPEEWEEARSRLSLVKVGSIG